MHSLYKTCLVVTSLLLFTCCQFTSDKSSETYTNTDTITLLLTEAHADIAPLAGPFTLPFIRQKNDSKLKLTIYTDGEYKFKLGSSSIRYFTFDLRNDTFKMIDAFQPYQLVHVFEDKKDPSIKLYKYERGNVPVDQEGATLFSKEYGYMGSAYYSVRRGNLVTHIDSKPIPKQYEQLFYDNRKQIFSKEWDYRLPKEKMVRPSSWDPEAW
ncbi:hypothetical protein [Xanthocytophaga agilis]|uniref:Lipoprotein n=1 Tax=Xanthocytophaga agilis TaxID=3048010 RepID=A0AAE3UDH7_9BACT|nr:hypothetical protein [Xanthocytophaga agilis]MDJ1501853.1 hypothetical protein [Xanthocytophaga agilis]